VQPLPARPLLVALYMTQLLRSARSPAPILSFSAAVYFFHTLAGHPSPTDHPLVGLAREIARRTRVAGQNKKQPLLASQIRQILTAWAGPHASLHHLMKATVITTCFVAFLRADSLLTLQWEDVRFVGQSHMELFLERSKTDQYREGAWTLVARIGGPFCPVALVERLITLGQYAGPGPLIRSVVVTRDRQYVKDKAPPYSTLLQWFKEAAIFLGLDPDLYGTHSGCRGGATGAAATDVPDRLFKQHGHWRSERAKDLYVVDRLPARLSVTRNLGLQPALSQSELEAFEREACFFSRLVSKSRFVSFIHFPQFCLNYPSFTPFPFPFPMPLFSVLACTSHLH
jgi:hypothetical protein